MKTILTISYFICSLSPIANAQWTQLGPEEGISPEGAEYSIVRVNPFDNQPYCAYVTFDPDGILYQASVQQWNGTEWNFVGGEFATLPLTGGVTSITPQSLEFEMNPVVNEPTIAVFGNDGDPETNNPDGAIVARYTGSAVWESYGEWPIIQTYGADVFQDIPSLALSPTSGFPVVGFTTPSAPNQSAIQWTPEGWDLMGLAEFSTSPSSFQSITFDPITSLAYIFHGGGTDFQHAISRFDGLLWETVGNDDFFPGTVGDARRQNTIVISPITGDPYIAYMTNEGPSGVAVRTLVDDEWVLVGPENQNPFQTPTPEGRLFDLEINPITGEPYVLLYSPWGEVIDTSGPTLWRFDGTEWVAVGGGSIETGILTGLSIAFDVETGAPYVSLISGSFEAETVKVYRWDGTVSSTEDLMRDDELRVYPNPVSRETTVLSPDPGNLFEYQLTDPTGRVLSTFSNRHARTHIDVSEFNPGVYHLSAISDGVRRTTKIVVGE